MNTNSNSHVDHSTVAELMQIMFPTGAGNMSIETFRRHMEAYLVILKECLPKAPLGAPRVKIDLTNPPDIQEITTAQLRQLLGGTLESMQNEELEDLIETRGFDPARLVLGDEFRLQSNCDGTHFLLYSRHRDVVWPPRCIQPQRAP